MSTKTMDYLENIIGGKLTFGTMLNALRKSDELSQADLAKKAKVSRGLICDIEKGRRQVTLEQAKKFAKVMGYSVEGFVSRALEDQIRNANLKFKVKLEAA